VAAAHVPGPDHEFRSRGPGGIFLAARGLASGVLVGDVVHLLLIAAVRPDSGCEGLVHVRLDCGVSLGFL
jgi:hypothetical protein